MIHIFDTFPSSSLTIYSIMSPFLILLEGSKTLSSTDTFLIRSLLFFLRFLFLVVVLAPDCPSPWVPPPAPSPSVSVVSVVAVSAVSSRESLETNLREV